MNAPHNHAFAEVIQSSLTCWQAQSWKWNYFPHFGSLVKITTDSIIIFGIVHDVQTGSIDSLRQPFPYQKTEDELLQEQPQIFEFLRTTFSCLVFGYKKKASLYYHLAPKPVKIHAFVEECDAATHRMCLSNEQFLLHLINLSSHIDNFEELLLALFNIMKQHNILTQNILERLLHVLSITKVFDYLALKKFTDRLLYLIKLENL